jgi:hypothetical protein
MNRNWRLVFALVAWACVASVIGWGLTILVPLTPVEHSTQYYTEVYDLKPEQFTCSDSIESKSQPIMIEEGVLNRAITESRGYLWKTVETTTHVEQTAFKRLAFYDEHHDRMVIVTIRYLITEGAN